MLVFFGLDQVIEEINLKEIISKLLTNSTSQDMEDLVSLIAEESADEIFKGVYTKGKEKKNQEML